jgi:apolipoprotein N-acyltransferase
MTPSRTRNEDASISELIQQLSEQTSRLARQEVELAKAEMTIKGKRLGIGAGAFGGAGLVALFGLGALTAAVILLLATAMSPWLAALIVAVVYLAVAGALALVGKSKVESATPPVPERTVASVKQDVEQTKLRAKEGRA